jgi:hypothetical protein
VGVAVLQAIRHARVAIDRDFASALFRHDSGNWFSLTQRP